jgi:hypothetical protein
VVEAFQRWLEGWRTRYMVIIFVLIAAVLARLADTGDFFNLLGDLARKVNFWGVRSRYNIPGLGTFERFDQGYWIETPPAPTTPTLTAPSNGCVRDQRRFMLREIQKDDDYFYLFDLSRLAPEPAPELDPSTGKAVVNSSTRQTVPDPTNPLVVRIHLNGDRAECSYENPLNWTACD